MFTNKKNTLVFTVFLLCGIFAFSSVTSVINISGNTNLSVENLDLEEEPSDIEGIIVNEPLEGDFSETTTPTYDRSEIEWRPIEESLKNIQINGEDETEAEGGSIDTALYNIATGIETITNPQFTPSPESSSEIRYTESQAGLLPDIGISEAVIGSDERTLAPNTAYPYRSIVKIYISAADGSNWVGSGAMVDSFHVLTAGHVAFLPDNGGWASQLEIVPGMDTSDTPSDPYGHAYATYMRSYTGWTISESSQHDWALITLDRNLGSYTGWMGRMTAGSSSSIYDNAMRVSGYPTDLSGGNRQYRDITHSGDGATSNNHYYWADTAGGMSGGPVWKYWWDGSAWVRHIMTVHAYGREGTDSNFGTRLNNNKYDQLSSWLSDDTAPTAKPDLVDQGSAYDSVTLGTWTADVTSVTLTNGIRNIGTATSGNYYVHYYASTNDYISEYDHYIGTSTVENTGALSSDSATFTGVLPASIPAGTYYIGWIIDNDDTVDEYDESNNKAVYAFQRTILGSPPPHSYIEVRVKTSATITPMQSVYVRTYNSGTATLIDTGYTDIDGFYNITDLADGSYDVYVSYIGYKTEMMVNVIHDLIKGFDDDYLNFYLDEYGPDTSWIEVTVRDSVTVSPIPSAYVQVTNMSSGLIIDTGWTNSAGFYNVTGLFIGWYEVTVSKVGYKNMIKQNYINWNHDDDYLYFYIQKMAANSGYIEVSTFNESGAVFAGATVNTYNASGLINTGVTNVNGTYNITGLVIGWYEVNVTYSGWQEQSKSTYINWNGDDDYLSYWMVPNPFASGYIEVTVRDSASVLPISWAVVEITNQSSGLVIQTGYTDPSGLYLVENLTIGWYTVSVSRVGYRTQSKQDYINWAGDDDYLSFYMVEMPPDSGYIEVTVKDNSTLTPIQNALVTTYYSNGTYFSSGWTDSLGFYNVTGLYVGWYEVVISHSSYGGASSYDYINWNGDDDYQTFYLVLKPPGWIEVTVLDMYNYNPIPDAYVRCYNTTSGELVDDGYTDAAGFYNITGLLIGWWTVNVSHPAFMMQSKQDYINWRGDDDYLTFYLDSYYKAITGPIAIFRDIFPWDGVSYGANVTEPILIENSIAYDIYNSSDMGVVDLSPYQKVIINSDQTQQFYNRLAGNATWFESYVLNGGFLLISACDNGWNGGDWDEASDLWPGGFNATSLYFNTVNISQSWHPVLLNPNLIEDDELDDWNWASHGYYVDYPTSTNKILIDSTTGNPVLIEFKYGDGYIISSIEPLEWNHGFNFTRLFENLILFDPAIYDDSINVTSPIGSDSWEVNSMNSITWETTGSITNVKIELYMNSVFIMELTASTPNDGSYSWTIPIGLTDSLLYQIRVVDIDYAATEDYSDNFEIEDPRTIIVAVPDSTTTWTMEDTETINWTSTGIIANVKIELYASSFLILEIAASTSNDGSFNWTIPDTLVNYTVYVIKISDVLDPTIYDDSDPFSIIAPPGGGAIPGFDLMILTTLILTLSMQLSVQ